MSLFTGEQLPGGSLQVTPPTADATPIVVNPLGRNTARQVMLINRSDFNQASGQDGIKVTVSARTTALTGNGFGINARGQNDVLTSTGKVSGLQAAGANNQTSADLTCHGADIFALGKGKDTGTLRGAEIQADNNEGTGTITTMVGLRVRNVGGGTITNGPWGVQIVNDSETALAAAKPLLAFIKCESAVATTKCGAIVDATSVRINQTTGQYSVSLTADDNVLFYYKDKDGTAHAVVATDGDALAVRT